VGLIATGPVGAERIKLTSTRAPWWSAAAALVATTGTGVLLAATVAATEPVTVAATQSARVVGTTVLMVVAVLAVTAEHATGTIGTTFLAVPDRGAALRAKAVVVAAFAGVVGLVGALGSWAASALLLPGSDLALDGLDEWRQVVGVGLVDAGAAVVGVAVGVLVRHTAGAVALVLVWVLVGEPLVALVPVVGPAAGPLLPFQAADRFLAGAPAGGGLLGSPWLAGVWFAVFAATLLAIAVGVARRRDLRG
jgi:ABC-2 type transport system permease protein